LERIRLDYPGSQLLPQTAYWAARTYFDQKKPELACRWISEGMSAAQGNVELQNQLGYLNQRCSQVAAAGPAAPDSTAPGRNPSDTQRTSGAPPSDTAQTSITLVPETPTPSPAPIRVDTQRTDPAAGPRAGGARYRVQITAVRSVSTARSVVDRLKSRGFNAVAVEEGGFYKVRVGNYATKAQAAAAIPEIRAKLGGSPFVVMES
jgi:cell division septation protein DedD